MYTFFKVFANGKQKQVLKTQSTLDVEYHAYINWCRENNVGWRLVRDYDGKVMFTESYNDIQSLMNLEVGRSHDVKQFMITLHFERIGADTFEIDSLSDGWRVPSVIASKSDVIDIVVNGKSLIDIVNR
jgi:hypothetical protein